MLLTRIRDLEEINNTHKTFMLIRAKEVGIRAPIRRTILKLTTKQGNLCNDNDIID